MSKWTRFLSVPILAVFLLVGFVYYVTVFVFIEDWVGIRSSSGSINALIFTFLASLCVFSFFVCVLTDPGHVPASYLPDVEETGISDEETKKNVRFFFFFLQDCLNYDLGFVCFVWFVFWVDEKTEVKR